MEIRTQGVVNELWFSFGWFRASAVLEDDVIIPSSLDLNFKRRMEYIFYGVNDFIAIHFTFRSAFGACAV
jgi:hypothetical protein